MLVNSVVIVCCRYPTRVEYDNIISALLLDYPFLRDYDGSGVSAVLCGF